MQLELSQEEYDALKLYIGNANYYEMGTILCKKPNGINDAKLDAAIDALHHVFNRMERDTAQR